MITGDQIEILDKNDISFPDVNVTEIRTNSKDELILGTENDGIILYANNDWHVFDSVRRISDVYIDGDDAIWFVYPNIAGIGKLLDNEYTFYYPPETLSGSPHMLSLVKDESDNIWCGSISSAWNGALFRFNVSTDEWTSLQAESSFAHDSFEMFHMAMDRKGNIWFFRGYSALCVYNEEGIKY